MFYYLSYSSFKNFQKQLNLTQKSEKLPLCDFDTGLFLTCIQILKMCEKIQDAGNYSTTQEASN